MVTPDREMCFRSHAVVAKGLAAESEARGSGAGLSAVASRAVTSKSTATDPAVQTGLSIRPRIRRVFINLVSSPAVQPPVAPGPGGGSPRKVAVETQEEKERHRRAITGDPEAIEAARSLPAARRWAVQSGARLALLHGALDIPLAVGSVRDKGETAVGGEAPKSSGSSAAGALVTDVLVHPWVARCATEAVQRGPGAEPESSFLKQLAGLCAQAAADEHGWKLAVAAGPVYRALEAVEAWEAKEDPGASTAAKDGVQHVRSGELMDGAHVHGGCLYAGGAGPKGDRPVPFVVGGKEGDKTEAGPRLSEGKLAMPGAASGAGGAPRGQGAGGRGAAAAGALASPASLLAAVSGRESVSTEGKSGDGTSGGKGNRQSGAATSIPAGALLNASSTRKLGSASSSPAWVWDAEPSGMSAGSGLVSRVRLPKGVKASAIDLQAGDDSMQLRAPRAEELGGPWAASLRVPSDAGVRLDPSTARARVERDAARKRWLVVEVDARELK